MVLKRRTMELAHGWCACTLAGERASHVSHASPSRAYQYDASTMPGQNRHSTRTVSASPQSRMGCRMFGQESARLRPAGVARCRPGRAVGADRRSAGALSARSGSRRCCCCGARGASANRREWVGDVAVCAQGVSRGQLLICCGHLGSLGKVRAICASEGIRCTSRAPPPPQRPR